MLNVLFLCLVQQLSKKLTGSHITKLLHGCTAVGTNNPLQWGDLSKIGRISHNWPQIMFRSKQISPPLPEMTFAAYIHITHVSMTYSVEFKHLPGACSGVSIKDVSAILGD